MRNALILLAGVALVILVMGALNNGTTFEVDYVAGTVNAVSLFWVSAVIAALVFVAGLAATWFALSAAAGGRRKLEAELQSTYERLREAEALAARPAPEPERLAPGETVEEEPPTAVEAVATVPAAEDETVVAGEAATIVVTEAATVVAGESTDDVTLVAGEVPTAVSDEDATEVSADAVASPSEPLEQTAVTATGAASVTGAVEDAAKQAENDAADTVAGEPGDERHPSGS